ncbi:D-glycerate 3-kinase, chloroplastic-like [Hevea brasiliensis]|uniref:D-glycerate 3-kinase, chloroplastic-like n=1 Tax=Hevea brasiliensis TaxID=3981 RepID=UPI002600E4FD|nr:D-glycerate 3-kinase, chloroplastic-like [Hevea brasiliensis]
MDPRQSQAPKLNFQYKDQDQLHTVFPTTPAQVSSVLDLYEFICSASLKKPQKARFYHYYIPVFLWCEDKISKYMSQFKDGEDIPPLVIGFSAPQAIVICETIIVKNVVSISSPLIADTNLDQLQAKLREENPGNALLDVSAYSGRGDRADPSMWPEVEGPLTLETVNKNLEAYYDAWDKFINAWIVIKIQDSSCVYQWHLQVKDFVSRYLPAHRAYLPTLYAERPSGSDPENVLLFEIDEGRNPILGD